MNTTKLISGIRVNMRSLVDGSSSILQQEPIEEDKFR